MNQTFAHNIQNNSIAIGDWAQVKMPDGSIREFTLASPQEINPSQGKISNESPIGKALWGHVAGDICQYRVGPNSRELLILQVKKA